jgi:hypothetical protein
MSKQSLPAATYCLTPNPQAKHSWNGDRKGTPQTIGFEPGTMVVTFEDLQRLGI